MTPPTLHERLAAMTHAEVAQWLRDRGVLVLEPRRRPQTVLILIACDVQDEIDAGRVVGPKTPKNGP